MYSVEMPLQLYFNTEEPVAIKDVADSLLAMEKLAKRLPIMLSQLSGVDIDRYELSVQRIESGSLIEALGMLVFLSTPEQRDALIKFLETHPMGKPLKYGLLTMLVLLLISDSYKLLTDFTKDDAPSIQGNHNTIINLTADQIDVPQETLEDALAYATGGNRKELVRAAMGVTKPIADHSNASLHVGDAGSNVAIPAEAMAEVPFDANLNAQEHDLPSQNVLLQIRALDRDKTDSGWWGVLPSVVGDKRLKIYFEDGVDIRAIAFRPEVHADVTVTYRADLNHATMVPKHITVSHIYPAERQ
ncbi:hypothetical protein FP66_08490 [Halomonas salina]|uniref:Uncharacterized protein n=1 Tax=Halomonas salina TaxID=42565 RepID=A0ABR4WSF8_9GAMM|nr:hypothetical protein FP66_08490 [Halomonas salina]